MPVYSHSQLSAYEDCPLKYKLHYRDKIKRDTEGIEAFVGSRVHETLKKCYDDIRLTKLDSLPELMAYYVHRWQKNWHDDIVISKKDVTAQHYQNLGKKMLETYYQHYIPFDADITIGTELPLNFTLDEQKRYRFTGFVDRLACTPDGICQIHDYKTSAHLSTQEEADTDRQLAIYQFGVKKKWPDIEKVKLVWHYLAFDREVVSTRDDATIAGLVTSTQHLIDKIETTLVFPPSESGLCDWCEYPDLCPNRKHFYIVDNLTVNKYLTEPGVALVNKYAALKHQATGVETELEEVRQALLEYARREGVADIKGTDHQIKIKLDSKLKFPGKAEAERQALEKIIRDAGKWEEVSQLDTAALTRLIGEECWGKELIDEIMKYGRLEESSGIYLSKLNQKAE